MECGRVVSRFRFFVRFSRTKGPTQNFNHIAYSVRNIVFRLMRHTRWTRNRGVFKVLRLRKSSLSHPQVPPSIQPRTVPSLGRATACGRQRESPHGVSERQAGLGLEVGLCGF